MEVSNNEIIVYIVIGTIALFFLYALIYPITPWGKAEKAEAIRIEIEEEKKAKAEEEKKAKDDAEKKAKDKAENIQKYGRDFVESAEKNQFMIGMPGDLIRYYFKKPADIRNKIIEAEKTTEEWYYYPLYDSYRNLRKDSNGEILYKKKLILENNVVTKIIEN